MDEIYSQIECCDGRCYERSVYVCEKHWPEGYEQVKLRNGKYRPANPPSLFENFKPSEIPTPPAKPRPTQRSSFEVRTRLEDELLAFADSDKLSYENLCADASSHTFCAPIISFVSGNCFWIKWPGIGRQTSDCSRHSAQQELPVPEKEGLIKWNESWWDLMRPNLVDHYHETAGL